MSGESDVIAALEQEDYSPEDPCIRLSMGAPGPECIRGCNDLVAQATTHLLMAAAKDLFSYLNLFTPGSDVIPLSMGAPGSTNMKGCSQLLKAATEDALGDADEEQFTFQYGPCKGDPGFRVQLSRFLTEEYGDPVSSEDVLVTAGATQGLHLVSTVMFDKDTPVFIEDPTYFIALKLLKQDFGMNTIPVPTDSEGMDLSVLETLLQKHRPQTTEELKSPFWAFIYTIPTFNNPKTYSMAPDRCKALVQLARKYDVLVLTEDVYNMLHYGQSPPRLITYDNRSDPDYKGHVLSNCTFSKILAPGLRLGWIEAPTRIMDCLEKCNTTWSGGSFNHYTSKLVASALRLGLLQQHVQQLRASYKERMTLACDELDKNLPEGASFTRPQGGFFIWLELPPLIDAGELLRLAVEKYNVNFIAGSSTSPTAGCTNCARLSVSFCDLDKLGTGILHFCDALKEMMSSKQSSLQNSG